MEQTTVTIGNTQWTVMVATTYSEVSQGLSDVSNLAPGTGMLFVLGADYPYIPIDMSRMLFPLDIIFISSDLRVTGIFRNVQPQETDVFCYGAYFLEVNAGEAEGIELGDSVSLGALQVRPALWETIGQIALATMIVIPLVVVLGKDMR